MRRSTLARTIAVGAALMLGLTACSGAATPTSSSPPPSTPSPATSEDAGGETTPTEPVELRMMWWGGDARHEATNKALDQFEADNPGIKVVRDYGGFDGYRDKLLTQFAGGQAPDVFQLYNEVLYEFAGNDQLMDLGTQKDNGLNLDGLPADLLESLSVDGKQFALPFGLSTHVMALNTAMFDAAGVELPDDNWTWEDLKTIGEKVSAAGGGKTFGVADLAHSYQPFEVWSKQRGEEYMTVDGLGFKEETLVEWWQYWDDMRKSGAATPADLTFENSAPLDMLISGDTASGFMFANQFASTQDSVSDKLAVLRFPGESQKPGQYLRTAMNLVMSSKAKHPEAAAKLMDYLINSPEANAILGIDRGVPANPAVVEAAIAEVDDVTKEALAIIDQVRENGAPPPVPQPPGAANVNALFAEISSKIAFGEMTVAEGAAAFMSQAPTEFAAS